MKENFDSYSIPDDEEKEPVMRYTMWNIVPLIMVMPLAGWRRAKENGPSPEIATIRFLLPVSILTGGAQFFKFLYQVQQSFANVLVEGVISFFTFFLGYYLALVLAKIFLPKAAKDFPSSAYGKLLTMTGVATLALFRILYMAVPMFDFIIEFLPLWTIFLIYRGMGIAGISQEKAGFAMGVMCVVVVCAPYIIECVFLLFA